VGDACARVPYIHVHGIQHLKGEGGGRERERERERERGSRVETVARVLTWAKAWLSRQWSIAAATAPEKHTPALQG